MVKLLVYCHFVDIFSSSRSLLLKLFADDCKNIAKILKAIAERKFRFIPTGAKRWQAQKFWTLWKLCKFLWNTLFSSNLVDSLNCIKRLCTSWDLCGYYIRWLALPFKISPIKPDLFVNDQILSDINVSSTSAWVNF